MSGMLSAIPKTPLYDRLASEGRLDMADRPEFGTNVIPLRIGREELLDGYLRVLKELYDPEAFFARTDALFWIPPSRSELPANAAGGGSRRAGCGRKSNPRSRALASLPA